MVLADVLLVALGLLPLALAFLGLLLAPRLMGEPGLEKDDEADQRDDECDDR